jgi:hypothetical protein
VRTFPSRRDWLTTLATLAVAWVVGHLLTGTTNGATTIAAIWLFLGLAGLLITRD